jgi:hypothetical protein
VSLGDDGDWRRRLAAVRAALATATGTSGSGPRRQELEFRKWRLLHKAVHRRRFVIEPDLSRAQQWRRARDHVADLEEPEVEAWIDQQVEIAAHRAAGIEDLRPRKDGPCQALLLEYVGNRTRKARALLRWAQEATASDPARDWDTTGDVIDKHRRRGD